MVKAESSECTINSHKKVFRMGTSTCRDGTLKNQPNKMGTTPQHIHTIPTSYAILPTMFCVVSCVHRRVVEGSCEGSAGCVVHVDVHGECDMLWVDAMYRNESNYSNKIK